MLRKDPPTYDLWHLSARHGFLELEKYCRQSLFVKEEISKIMANPKQGFVHLLGLPMSLVNRLVCDLFKPPEPPKMKQVTRSGCRPAPL